MEGERDKRGNYENEEFGVQGYRVMEVGGGGDLFLI